MSTLINFIFNIIGSNKLINRFEKEDIVIVEKRNIIYRAAWKAKRMMRVIDDTKENLVKVYFDGRNYFVPRRCIRLANDNEQLMYHIFGSEAFL